MNATTPASRRPALFGFDPLPPPFPWGQALLIHFALGSVGALALTLGAAALGVYGPRVARLAALVAAVYPAIGATIAYLEERDD